MARNLLLTAGAAAAWLVLGHFGLLAILVYVWVSALTSTNTAKSRATEQRVNAIVSAQTTQNQAIIALQAGNFPGNVTVGGTLTVTGAAGVHGNLTVDGAAGLNATGGTTTISGACILGQDVTLNSGTLTTFNTVGINGALYVTGFAHLEGGYG